jgi:hypothetical protein
MTGPWMTGPYGTNLGDIWLGVDSPVGQMLKDREGLTLIHEVLNKDGEIQECLYVTDDAELIRRAEEGTVRYWQQKGSEN